MIEELDQLIVSYNLDQLIVSYNARDLKDPVKRYSLTIYGKDFSDDFILDTSDIESSIKEFKNFIIQSRRIPLLEQSYLRVEYEQIFIN